MSGVQIHDPLLLHWGHTLANISWVSAPGGKDNQSQDPELLPGTVTVISHLIFTPSAS